MSKKASKYILIAGLVYGFLGIALILSITLSRYAAKINGYTDFGPANFNAAILVPQPTEGATDTVVNKLSAQEFHPGMVVTADRDTANRITFQVANGTNLSNVAGTDIQYTVRIRTSNSLPLEYTLRDGDAYYKAGADPQPIQAENAQTRYEYVFKTDLGLEPQFFLKRDTQENNVVSREHQLILEWPAVGSNTSSTYMKEVEIVEILVTVTAVNNLGGDDYYKPPATVPPEYTYSTGVILLIPPKSDASGSQGDENSYRYAIDLRSFQENDTMGVYQFTLDNAVGQGITQDKAMISYTMQLKIPAELMEKAYSFSLWREDAAVMQDLLAEAPLYQLYDEKTEEPYGEACASLEELGSYDKTLYRAYAIYDVLLGDDNILHNLQYNSVGQAEPQIDIHKYALVIDTLNGVDGELAFSNKLELLVEAVFSNQEGSNEPPTEPPTEPA